MFVACLAFINPLGAEEFPKLYDSEPESNTMISPAEALKKIELPSGFRAELFAHEPDVQNPIGMSFDSRGRLWVAENYTYAERGVRFDLKLRDRIVILEDADNDGKAEKRTVFSDDVQMLTGLAVSPEGVWAICPPRLIFIPDKNRDDVPDGPAVDVLDGFTVAQENYHNFANGLKLGLDGWLYGRCGASCPGEVGVPGADPAERIPMRGGLWRYHPTAKIFEPLTQGTTNPWGHDWNRVGEPFFINTVNGHLWHAIPGAHFVRPHTLDSNPHAYELIDLHADHWHFDTGKSWTDSRNGAANSYGGGHAHIGCMIYEGDSWPETYRGKLFTLNMHGRRINVDRLEQEGSGYVGKHEPDMVLFGDTWFRGIELDYGPDGNVYVLDWSDTGECHDSNGVHRHSGRIYKISYGANRPSLNKDILKLSPTELADLHGHANQWFVRQARIALAAKHRQGEPMEQVIAQLRSRANDTAANSAQRLDALWTLMQLNAVNEAYVQQLLGDKDAHIRAAVIKYLTQYWPIDTSRGGRPVRMGDTAQQAPFDGNVFKTLVKLASGESSPVVRLVLASTLQRLPEESRVELALELVKHASDANDHNLPLMIWYALIPVAEKHPQQLVQVFNASKSPITRRLIARRLTENLKQDPAPIDAVLQAAQGDSVRDALAGVSRALSGWLKPPKPLSWDKFAAKVASAGDANAQEQLRQLNALFGDGRSLDELKKIVRDGSQEMTTRTAALQSLVDIRATDMTDLFTGLLGTRYLNAIAVQGLARESSPEIGEKMLKAYRSFTPLDRPAVIATLCTRATWGLSLLNAVENKQVPKEDLNANHARQLLALNDAKLNERLEKVWGQVRETPADKLATIERWKSVLSKSKFNQEELIAGKATFKKVCGNCHKLYGEGGKIGPDLTGAQRQNSAYLLENIIDPSAVVTADFRMSTLLLSDGRVLSGIITERNEQRVVLQMQNEALTLSADEVESVKPSTLSLMPDGLLQTLSEQETRSLLGYLMTRSRIE